MPGDVTTLLLSTDTSIVTVSSGEVSVVQLMSNNSQTGDITVLNTSSATITLPTTISFSDSIPLELANVGSSGSSTLAARSDHIHPSTGMTMNGGNY